MISSSVHPETAAASGTGPPVAGAAVVDGVSSSTATRAKKKEGASSAVDLHGGRPFDNPILKRAAEAKTEDAAASKATSHSSMNASTPNLASTARRPLTEPPGWKSMLNMANTPAVEVMPPPSRGGGSPSEPMTMPLPAPSRLSALPAAKAEPLSAESPRSAALNPDPPSVNREGLAPVSGGITSASTMRRSVGSTVPPDDRLKRILESKIADRQGISPMNPLLSHALNRHSSIMGSGSSTLFGSTSSMVGNFNSTAATAAQEKSATPTHLLGDFVSLHVREFCRHEAMGAAPYYRAVVKSYALSPTRGGGALDSSFSTLGDPVSSSVTTISASNGSASGSIFFGNGLMTHTNTSMSSFGRETTLSVHRFNDGSSTRLLADDLMIGDDQGLGFSGAPDIIFQDSELASSPSTASAPKISILQKLKHVATDNSEGMASILESVNSILGSNLDTFLGGASSDAKPENGEYPKELKRKSSWDGTGKTRDMKPDDSGTSFLRAARRPSDKARSMVELAHDAAASRSSAATDANQASAGENDQAVNESSTAAADDFGAEESRGTKESRRESLKKHRTFHDYKDPKSKNEEEFGRRRVRSRFPPGGPTWTAQAHWWGVVASADISGYSRMAAMLAGQDADEADPERGNGTKASEKRKAYGAELLSKTINDYFAKAVQIIESHGGDIISFNGDAVIFCWRLSPDLGTPMSDVKGGAAGGSHGAPISRKGSANLLPRGSLTTQGIQGRLMQSLKEESGKGSSLSLMESKIRASVGSLNELGGPGRPQGASGSISNLNGDSRPPSRALRRQGSGVVTPSELARNRSDPVHLQKAIYQQQHGGETDATKPGSHTGSKPMSQPASQDAEPQSSPAHERALADLVTRAVECSMNLLTSLAGYTVHIPKDLGAAGGSSVALVGPGGAGLPQGFGGSQMSLAVPQQPGGSLLSLTTTAAALPKKNPGLAQLGNRSRTASMASMADGDGGGAQHLAPHLSPHLHPSRPSASLHHLHVSSHNLPVQEAVEIKIHVGIAAGALCDIHLGYETGRRTHFIAGPGIVDLGDSLGAASAGELALTESARTFLDKNTDVKVEYVLRTAGEGETSASIVKSLTRKQKAVKSLVKSGSLGNVGPAASRRKPWSSLLGGNSRPGGRGELAGPKRSKRIVPINGSDDEAEEKPEPQDDNPSLPSQSFQPSDAIPIATKEVEKLLRYYVNESVLYRFVNNVTSSAGGLNGKVVQSAAMARAGRGFQLESELRQVTAIFLLLTRAVMDPESRYPRPSRALAALGWTFMAVRKYEGTVFDMSADDKGVSMLAIFGLPPHTHEQEAGFAIRAAADISRSLQQAGLHGVSIGVATGTVYVGLVGGIQRCSHTVLGDPINTAARLMCMPEAVNGVLCDPITRELCQKIQGVSFRNLGPRNLKGRDQPMTVYRWNDSAQGEGQIGKLSTGWNNRPTVDVANLVGYDQQKKQIKTVVAQFASDNLGKTVVIEGTTGSGKTAMVDYAEQTCRSMSIAIARANASEIEQSTPLHVYKALFLQLIRLLEVCVHDNLDSKLALKKAGIFSLRQATTNSGHRSAGESPGSPDVTPSSNRSSLGISPQLARASLGASLGTAHSGLTLRGHRASIFVSNASALINPNSGGAALAAQKHLGGSTGALPTTAAIHNNNIGHNRSTDASTSTASNLESTETIGGMPRSSNDITKAKEETRKRVELCLSLIGEDPKLAPIFNTLLPYRMLEETSRSSALDGGDRFDLVSDLLVRLIEVLSSVVHVSIFLEDAQWLDRSSWILTNKIVKKLNVLVVIACRPRKDYDLELLDDLIIGSAADVVELPGLGPSETAKLLCSLMGLGADRVEPQLLDLVHARTGGNPLFIINMAAAMKLSGRIIEAKGELRAAMDGLDFLDLVVPGDIRSAILLQYDRLHYEFQLVLRAASVVDILWDLSEVLTLLPTEHNFTIERLKSIIEEYDMFNFLVLEDLVPIPRYSFRHVHVKQVIYETMLFSERKRMHNNLALHYEAQLNQENRFVLLPVITHHILQTDDLNRKVVFLEETGAMHLERFILSEAHACFMALFECFRGCEHLLDDHEQYPPLRQARWYIGLSLVEVQRCQFYAAWPNMVSAMSLLGLDWPSGKWEMWYSLTKYAFFDHLWLHQRLTSSFPNPRKSEDPAVTNEMLMLLKIFSVYFSHVRDNTALSLAHLRSLDLCVRSNKLSPNLVRSLASVALISRLFVSRTISRVYLERCHHFGRILSSTQGMLPEGVGEVLCLVHFENGEWEACAREAELGMHDGKTRRDRLSYSKLASMLCIVLLLVGRNPDARKVVEEVILEAELCKDEQIELTGMILGICVEQETPSENGQRIVSYFKRAQKLMSTKGSSAFDLAALEIFESAHVYASDQMDVALQKLTKTLWRVLDVPAPFFSMIAVVVCMLTTSLLMRAKSDMEDMDSTLSPVQRKKLAHEYEDLIKTMEKLSRAKEMKKSAIAPYLRLLEMVVKHSGTDYRFLRDYMPKFCARYPVVARLTWAMSLIDNVSQGQPMFYVNVDFIIQRARNKQNQPRDAATPVRQSVQGSVARPPTIVIE